MTNILHISRTMDVGGAEKIVYQLATDLKENFDTVHIASTGGLWEKLLKKNGVKHHKILDIESKSIKTLVRNFKILYSILKENNIDIVHTHHRMAAFYIRLLKRFFPKIKHVYTAHNIFRDKLKLYKFSLENTTVVAVGRGVKKHLKEELKINNSVLIYNAIPMKRESQPVTDISDIKAKKIGFIGRLSEQKGVKYLIEAIKLLEAEDIVVFIAGSGELEDDLKEQARKLGLSKKIVFLGYKGNTSDIITSCDFMVMPSLYEGLPLTLIEYFQNGKTVVATKIPGIEEVITSGYNGLLVNPKNSKELAEDIKLLLNNERLKEDLEKNAIKTYETRFSYNDFIEKYSKVYFE